MAWLAGWAAGVALQWQQAALWPAAAYGALLLAAALAGAGWRWLRTRRRNAAWLVALACAALLGFASTGLRALYQQSDVLAPPLEERDMWLRGTVADLPQSHPDGQTVVVAVEEADIDGRPVAVPRRVRLFWPGAPMVVQDVQAGQIWRWPVRLRAPHGLANPHGFDRELWLWEQGVGATGVVRVGRHVRPPEALGSSPWFVVDRWRGELTAAVRARVDDPRSAGVIAALLVGNQSAIARDDWQVFRDTGVAHLMAISGLHITLFAWLATRLVGSLWRRLAPVWPGLLLRWPTPLAAAFGGLALAAAYALLAGWGVPAQRTVFMLATVVVLRWRGLDWPWPQVWLWCLALVLALDPWAGLQPGFWLSFVAVMLLFASDPRGGGSKSPLQALRSLLREQVVMTLALAPLTLLLFGQVSVVGLLANLLAIPWVTLLVTPLVLLGVLLTPLWDVAAWALQLMAAVLQPMAQWPGAVWHAPAPPWPVAVLGVCGAVLATVRAPVPWRLMGALLAWPAVAFVPARPAAGEFDLWAPDVGQGSAVLVRTAHHSLLFDAGARYRSGGDVGERVLVPWLRRQGERLDLLVVSHRDSDHAGGAESVLRAQPTAALLASYDFTTDVPPLPALGTRMCQAGQRWVWDGVNFEVLHPSAADHARADLPSNAMSCVLRVHNGRRVAWLTGDVGHDQEVSLAARHPGQRADVLMAPHHGSRSSSSPVWLNELMPRWVLIQAGHLNRFGHPAPEVVARYEARAARWLATPACGEMRWHSAAPDTVRCHRDAARRYWHWRAPAIRLAVDAAADDDSEEGQAAQPGEDRP
jgi:competence protein ComEC